MFDELEEMMELREYRKLYQSVEARRQPGAFHLSARILNMLWINFSNDQQAECVLVDDESVYRFIIWIASGNPDDAWV